MMTNTDAFLSAAECARQVGLSVRTLRVYEDRGLLAPRRTAQNWRVYGTDELTRLSEILTLKSMGLSLSQIGAVLSERDTNLTQLIAVQHEQLLQKQQGIERTLALVATLRAKTARGDVLSVNDLITLAKETNAMAANTETIAWKRYEQMRPRTEVAISPEERRLYTGYYLFDDGTACEIFDTDDGLQLQMLGQPAVPLFAEATDRFFMRAVAAQVTFERQGDVIGRMVLHQGGFDMIAQPVDAARFAAAKAALEDRVNRKAARPGSAVLLRQIIEDHRAGSPDYKAMAEPLAKIVQEQLPVMIDELTRLGAITDIDFMGVDQQGADIYQVTFDNGKVECGLSLGQDGLINGLYLRPAV